MALGGQQLRNLGLVFVSAYLVAGAYLASSLVSLYGLGYRPELGAGNLLVYGAFAVPLAVASGTAIAWAWRRDSRPLLWGSTAIWLFLSVSELLEGNAIVLNEVVVLLMLVVSSACVIYLLSERRRSQHQRE